MLGLFVELAISWLLLWLFERKNLLALGIRPTKPRAAHFIVGFLVAAICCTGYCMSFTIGVNNQWVINEAFDGSAFASGSWWTFKSVIFEELIFRGALLYILLNRMRTIYACIISAIAFGIYHWFTMNVLGNPVQMAFTFLITGLWGFMFAMAFAKTGSLYLPVGLHFGWNLFLIVVFSQGPLGRQFLVLEGVEKTGAIIYIPAYLFQVLAVPLIVYWYLKKQSNHRRSAAAAA